MSRPPFTDRAKVRQTVSLRLPRHLVEQVDQAAKQYRLTRTRVFEVALTQLLQGGR
jgi:predicted transcriptional regulator